MYLLAMHKSSCSFILPVLWLLYQSNQKSVSFNDHRCRKTSISKCAEVRVRMSALFHPVILAKHDQKCLTKLRCCFLFLWSDDFLDASMIDHSGYNSTSSERRKTSRKSTIDRSTLGLLGSFINVRIRHRQRIPKRSFLPETTEE